MTTPKTGHQQSIKESINAAQGVSRIPEYMPEDIPDLIDEMYVCGRCMYLAAALNRVIHWPISVSLSDDTDKAYIEHAWVANEADSMMFDINGCYPDKRNSFIFPDSAVVTGLTEDELFSLTIKTSGRDMLRADWDAEVADALVIVDQYFKTQVAIAATKAWPEFLENAEAIAEYVADLSPYDISLEQIEELYFGCRGRLAWVDLSTILLRDEDHNMPTKARQKKVDSLPVATMPPLLVDDSVLEDGYHRMRKLMKDGITHHWAYVVEEAPEPTPAPTMKKASRWDSLYDMAP